MRRLLIGLSLATVLVIAISPVAGQTESKATGTLTFAGQTYRFIVDFCDFNEGQGLPSRHLAGTGKTSDGQMFMVIVAIAESPKWVDHGVSLMLRDGPIVAEYRKTAKGWVNKHGPAQGPLIRVEGSKIVAKGIFVRGGYQEKVLGEGFLEAPCPRPS